MKIKPTLINPTQIKGFMPTKANGTDKGMVLPSKRAENRRTFKFEPTFDHFGAAGARLRIKTFHEENPRKPVVQPVLVMDPTIGRLVKKVYNITDHIHPRSKRIKAVANAG